MSSLLKKGLTVDDIIVGLEVGQLVEARCPNKVHLQCTGVCWTVTGSSIATSYGRTDITGWCDYPGAVCVWNIFARDLNLFSPAYVLDHTSCLMCVRCHPEQPSLIAAGSFNGEVIVWDVTNPEGQPLALSIIDDYCHKEPVVNLEWTFDSTRNEFILVSAGIDGKVLCWSMKNKFNHPIRGAFTNRLKSIKRSYPLSHGATSLALSSGSSNTSASGDRTRAQWVVVGQEGGAITRGQAVRLLSSQVFTSETFKSRPNVDELFGAIKGPEEKFSHENHIGPVSALDCSPFNRNLFLSAGQDGMIQLLHMLSRQPIRKWEPTPGPGITSRSLAITCIKFSPLRPLVFAAGSAGGFVFIFDLAVSTSLPVAVLETPALGLTGTTEDGAGDVRSTISTESETSERLRNKPGNSKRSIARRVGVSSLSFNRKQRDLLAACDYAGRVHIWRLSWKLAHRNPDEQVQLDRLASSIGENDYDIDVNHG